jgi:hypothetical protein
MIRMEFLKPEKSSGSLLITRNFPIFSELKYQEVLLLQKPSQARGMTYPISMDARNTRHGILGSSHSSTPLFSECSRIVSMV